MSSPLQFLAPTNPKHLPADKHLVHSKGTAGLVGWIIHLNEFLRPFGLAGQEFADGVYHDIPPPDINAVFAPSLRRTLPPAINMTTPHESHVPAPPTHPTNPGRDLEEELREENGTGGGGQTSMAPATPLSTRAPLHSFSAATALPPPRPPAFALPKYEKDANGELTANGAVAFRKAHEAHEVSLTAFLNLRLVLFTYILAQMTTSSTDALKLNRMYINASADNDLCMLRIALEQTHSSNSLVVSLDTFTNVTSAKQGPDTLTTFLTQVAVNIAALKAAFASPSHPDFISIKSLHLATILAGINATQFQAYLDKLSLEPSLHHMDQLDVTQVTAELTTFANNKVARSTNAKTINPPNQEMSLQQAQKLVKEHKLKQQQQQTTTGNALINASPTPNENNNNKTSLWTEAHPHSRPSRDTPGPGNINEPHCPHCAKINRIYNNHGHGTLKACSDVRSPPQQQHSLMTNLLALMNGTASQQQQDSMTAFMDASCFDASALAAMNSGLGASVADADADDEARRAVSAAGGGGAPKN